MKTKIGIIALAFGRPKSLPSNRIISEIVTKKAKELSAPVYTQFDIRPNSKVDVYYTKEKPGHPAPTLRVMRGAVQWAYRKGITKFLIVAAKPHLPRGIRDLNYAMKEAKYQVEIEICKEIEAHSDKWFCPQSKQRHTRSKWIWKCREFIIRLLPFFVYKRIAG